ncbi:hypothetical protein HNO88_003982 [Novosphingobium chloroacetimidivorans]|uniref:Uncharacterized protein n=1 Tax=Novosphingobium chloroacetimidivorans TaxID=1428314 RepID=A0A7W7KEC4_9SPHN|nr:hypothetical protein [Novosphingobium chloroacetimidivorans]
MPCYYIDEGFVVRSVLDNAGNFQINPDVRDKGWMKKVHGAVEVTRKGENT